VSLGSARHRPLPHRSLGVLGAVDVRRGRLLERLFQFLLGKKWTVKTTHDGAKWTGPKQYEADGGKLMMLPTDMVLIEDPAFKKWVDVYAASEASFFADFAVAFQKLTELGFKQ